MNGTNQYIPRKGDIVLINFNPSAGREIQKYRPALVVSNQKYARLTKLALVCPITHAVNNRMAALGLLIKIKTPKVDAISIHSNFTRLITFVGICARLALSISKY